MKSNAIRSRPRLARRFVGHPAAAGGLCLLVLLTAGCESLLSRLPGASEPTRAPQKPAPAPTTVPDEPAPEPAPERDPTQRPGLDPAEQAEVERLLARADRAIEDDHLTYPSRGSALALYDRVTILDPDNEEARRGLERIVERYLELATSASEQRRFAHAEAMLDRARLVDPQHPGITPTAYQVRLLADAERQVIRLDGERLRNQDPGLADDLRQAGLASRGDGCRARIVARSDSEGRWIYQQMSDAPGKARISAQLDIGSTPRIEVLCFPD